MCVASEGCLVNPEVKRVGADPGGRTRDDSTCGPRETRQPSFRSRGEAYKHLQPVLATGDSVGPARMTGGGDMLDPSKAKTY